MHEPNAGTMKKLIILTVTMIGCYLLGLSHSSPISTGNPQVYLVSIHDGDTITVDIVNWPPIIGHHIPIRIKGIDTPEMNDKSERVRSLAIASKEFLESKISKSSLQIHNLERDKYFRISADVYADGTNVGNLLLKKGFAKPYDGGKKPVWK
jgi:endonuclease YncB( thermonuclease family)